MANEGVLAAGRQNAWRDVSHFWRGTITAGKYAWISARTQGEDKSEQMAWDQFISICLFVDVVAAALMSRAVQTDSRTQHSLHTLLWQDAPSLQQHGAKWKRRLSRFNLAASFQSVTRQARFQPPAHMRHDLGSVWNYDEADFRVWNPCNQLPDMRGDLMRAVKRENNLTCVPNVQKDKAANESRQWQPPLFSHC